MVRFDGHSYGVVSLDQARQIASDEGLDLVEISASAKPPVIKVIDYGKFKYDQQKKKNEAKKRQAVVQLKEVQFRPNIESHDLEIKLDRAKRFLFQGDKVKLVMQFRGREMSYKKAGEQKFASIIQRLLDMGGKIESEPKGVNNRIISIVGPDKRKSSSCQRRRKRAPPIHPPATNLPRGRSPRRRRRKLFGFGLSLRSFGDIAPVEFAKVVQKFQNLLGREIASRF